MHEFISELPFHLVGKLFGDRLERRKIELGELGALGREWLGGFNNGVVVCRSGGDGMLRIVHQLLV